jgi:SAM-dependent methyltransferase
MPTTIQAVVNKFCPSVTDDNADDVADLCLKKLGWHNMATGELIPGLKVTADDTVVDVGCGLGHASVFAAKQGAEVVGIDISRPEIEGLTQRFGEVQVNNRRRAGRPLRAVVSDCNPIPLPDKYATVVLAMEVLEHVDDPARFMNELLRIGHPGARYLIAVPDPLCESVQRKIAPPSYWEKPNHLRVFDREDFQQLLEAAGLVVDQRLYYGFFWSVWWSLYWAVPPNNIGFGKSGDSPLLRNWNKTWKALLTAPEAHHVWKALENAMPKSQAILAHKPEHSTAV